jgi:hypothetical protein
VEDTEDAPEVPVKVSQCRVSEVHANFPHRRKRVLQAKVEKTPFLFKELCDHCVKQGEECFKKLD